MGKKRPAGFELDFSTLTNTPSSQFMFEQLRAKICQARNSQNQIRNQAKLLHRSRVGTHHANLINSATNSNIIVRFLCYQLTSRA
jgi:hypothetical protein